ncbi:dihydroorotate dehydrogenase [Methylacidiphilum kamchatkense Kam1]|uniref:dihydrouracil dehydrogenase (NAD(+)) n=1 Tax=Methylacidiphilum kamchatkense Kam1 TaxID=1202785 RepID=A0A0C1RW40_9BACT|nr:NAD-dependent dihydropyrimidine dehydrogenase subunit PreA [Methylacidiphilum kamchatkense]KIE59146.1 dihydroorotate dehydrogenase [Methylacidiphilum kamchatkense Kam1]QDQ42927.1 dihydroorotate oxidase B catalytic subunit /dihydrouracil dehydrogenase (NAD+) /dihydropyrimidine dehydrogenase (NADP+) [Methylacidiphilum kamchatkense Kam1]
MIELSIEFAGIRSINPFWLASGPPTNSAAQVNAAFEAGFGGAVWKTIGTAVENVSNRYSSYKKWDRILGLNNLELISDRPLELNLKEIQEVKKRWPDRALIVSIMEEYDRGKWEELVKKVEASGADGIELNFGCPHGMPERGTGSKIGQDPTLCREVTSWVKRVTRLPLIVKLTPNVTDITQTAQAAMEGGASALSLINTIPSITGVDLDTFEVLPSIGGKSSYSGYSGEAIKPIALGLTAKVASMQIVQEKKVPISAMGGISNWRDSVEFLLLGAISVQLCSAVMLNGFRIIDDLLSGLKHWMQAKGFSSIADFRGKSLSHIVPFRQLEPTFKLIAQIDPQKCIRCFLCYIVCRDAAHRCIDLTDGKELYAAFPPSGKHEWMFPKVRIEDCVGCSLCQHVCPVDSCIEMITIEAKNLAVRPDIQKKLSDAIGKKVTGEVLYGCSD